MTLKLLLAGTILCSVFSSLVLSTGCRSPDQSALQKQLLEQQARLNHLEAEMVKQRELVTKWTQAAHDVIWEVETRFPKEPLNVDPFPTSR